ncbi:MAG: hypothetical protein LBN97_09220 [Oscillospiraceae bacterium]|jgi:flavodoxin|nr:hypothetical protein [Oscillospiraceae bacterium]
MSKSIAIVYYSQSGSTEKLVKLIQTHITADALALDDKGSFKAAAPDLGKYDTILVGGPNWAGTASGPVKAFLTANDLSGKDFAPFCTHGMGGEQNVTTDMAKLTPNAKILPSLAVKGVEVDNSDALVINWLGLIGLNA